MGILHNVHACKFNLEEKARELRTLRNISLFIPSNKQC